MSKFLDQAGAGALGIFNALQVRARSDYVGSDEALESLRDEMDRHLLALQKLARKNEMMPIDLAEAMVSGLHVLLDALASFSLDEQTAVVGAALYFISDTDELPDMETILGLDDDVLVFNHVVALVGRPDLSIEP